MDLTLRRTLSAGPKGVHLRENCLSNKWTAVEESEESCEDILRVIGLIQQISREKNIWIIKALCSLCQALRQCRWAKKANEKRKKCARSETVSERKKAGREKFGFSIFFLVHLILSPQSSRGVFAVVFDPFSHCLGASNRLGSDTRRG